MDKNQNEIYEYADGSGNKYIIKNDLKIFIEYIPIKPHLSSSGFYDGGDYKKKEITKLDFNKIYSIHNLFNGNAKSIISFLAHFSHKEESLMFHIGILF